MVLLTLYLRLFNTLLRKWKLLGDDLPDVNNLWDPTASSKQKINKCDSLYRIINSIQHRSPEHVPKRSKDLLFMGYRLVSGIIFTK